MGVHVSHDDCLECRRGADFTKATGHSSACAMTSAWIKTGKASDTPCDCHTGNANALTVAYPRRMTPQSFEAGVAALEANDAARDYQDRLHANAEAMLQFLDNLIVWHESMESPPAPGSVQAVNLARARELRDRVVGVRS